MTSEQYKANLQRMFDLLEGYLLENVKLRQILEEENIPNTDERLRSVELSDAAQAFVRQWLEWARLAISEESDEKVSASLLKGIPTIGKTQ